MRHVITVRIPPATDVEGLVNLYLQLLSARNVRHDSPVSGKHFDHPIPESRQSILTELDMNSNVLGSLSLQYSSITLARAICNDRTMTMVLECENPNPDFNNVPFTTHI